MSFRPDLIRQYAMENAEAAIRECAGSSFLWESVPGDRCSPEDEAALRDEMRRIAENVARGRAS